MSIDFTLLTKDNDKVVVVDELTDQACFYPLSSEDKLQVYCPAAAKTKVTGICYKPSSSLSNLVAHRAERRLALSWIKAVVYNFGFEKYLPKQNLKSIYKQGIYIDGDIISGPAMLGLLSFVRCLEEEPAIVHSFGELMKFPGMDEITAIVLAHGVSVDHFGRFYNSCPSNTNHTVFIGVISEDTLKDAWSGRWAKEDALKERWTANRNTHSVFKLFSEKGNKYVMKHVTNKWGNNKLSKDEMQLFLENEIYPLRQKFFGEAV